VIYDDIVSLLFITNCSVALYTSHSVLYLLLRRSPLRLLRLLLVLCAYLCIFDMLCCDNLVSPERITVTIANCVCK